MLSHLHQYIPTVTTEDEVAVQGEEKPVKVTTDTIMFTYGNGTFHPIAIGKHDCMYTLTLHYTNTSKVVIR